MRTKKLQFLILFFCYFKIFCVLYFIFFSIQNFKNRNFHLYIRQKQFFYKFIEKKHRIMIKVKNSKNEILMDQLLKKKKNFNSKGVNFLTKSEMKIW